MSALATPHAGLQRSGSCLVFACSFCGKAFGRASHRKRHELTHTLAARHRCSECGKDFLRRCVRAFVAPGRRCTLVDPLLSYASACQTSEPGFACISASYHPPPHFQQSQAPRTTVADRKTVMRYAGMKPPIAHPKLALRTRTTERAAAAPLQESSALARSSVSAAASVTVAASIRTQTIPQRP